MTTGARPLTVVAGVTTTERACAQRDVAPKKVMNERRRMDTRERAERRPPRCRQIGCDQCALLCHCDLRLAFQISPASRTAPQWSSTLIHVCHKLVSMTMYSDCRWADRRPKIALPMPVAAKPTT